MLINFFNLNPPLWNHHLTEYRDRNLLDWLLEKLVDQFEGKFSKEDIKRKWHNLQRAYKREKAREDGSKISGSVSCEVYVSSWELFSQMEFLDVTGDWIRVIHLLIVQHVHNHRKRSESNQVTPKARLKQSCGNHWLLLWSHNKRWQ